MRTHNFNHVHALILAVIAIFTTGCATYRTPGAGINLGNLSQVDGDIAEIMKREPAAPFPSRLAVARIQSTGYFNRNSHCYGKGAYCVVTTRDVETDQDLKRLGRLPMISSIASMNQLLLPELLLR